MQKTGLFCLIGRLTHERKIDILSLVSSPEQYDSRLNLRTNISMYLLSTYAKQVGLSSIPKEPGLPPTPVI